MSSPRALFAARPSAPARLPGFAGLLVGCLLVTAVAGCASDGEKRRPFNPFKGGDNKPGYKEPPRAESAAERSRDAGQMYKSAADMAKGGSYAESIKEYDRLIARYPFSEQAVQAQVEKIYANYRNYDPDTAVLLADRFLKERPRHPQAPYVQYVRGMADYDRIQNVTERFGVDTSGEDITYARRGFDSFATLIQKYPDSVYDGDARLRMIELRNRMANHELSIINFYMRRQAWLSAARRAESLIAQYPGAPATYPALDQMAEAYRQMGLTDQVADVVALRDGQNGTNAPKLASGDSQPGNSGWWDRMTGLFSFGAKAATGNTATDTALVPAAPPPVATAATAGTPSPEAATPPGDKKLPPKVTLGPGPVDAAPTTAGEPPIPTDIDNPQTR